MLRHWRIGVRKRGYATELPRQTLERPSGLGLSEVLVTCDKSNKASSGVILRNGGVLDSEEYLPDHGLVVQRYWILIKEGRNDG